MRSGYNGKIIPESNLKKDENESGGFARLVFAVFISEKKRRRFCSKSKYGRV